MCACIHLTENEITKGSTLSDFLEQESVPCALPSSPESLYTKLKSAWKKRHIVTSLYSYKDQTNCSYVQNCQHVVSIKLIQILSVLKSLCSDIKRPARRNHTKRQAMNGLD